MIFAAYLWLIFYMRRCQLDYIPILFLFYFIFLIWYLKHENGMFKNIFIHININYIYIYESELNSWPDSSVG